LIKLFDCSYDCLDIELYIYCVYFAIDLALFINLHPVHICLLKLYYRFIFNFVSVYLSIKPK